jgi:hypothetical protein
MKYQVHYRFFIACCSAERLHRGAGPGIEHVQIRALKKSSLETQSIWRLLDEQ